MRRKPLSLSILMFAVLMAPTIASYGLLPWAFEIDGRLEVPFERVRLGTVDRMQGRWVARLMRSDLGH